jgi:hypothetical protein
MAIDMEKNSVSGALTADPWSRVRLILLPPFSCVATGGICVTVLLRANTLLEYLFTVDFEVKELGVSGAIVNERPPVRVRKMK